MPTSVGSALLLAGIVFALIGVAVVAGVLAGLGVLWETFLFIRAGLT